MAVPDWPATLPQSLEIEGYTQSPADVLLRTAPDAGPAKVRRRFTAGIEPVKGKIMVTSTQLGYFRTFFDTTLFNGSLRFNWKDPITAAAKELRFTKQPSWTPLGGTMYLINMDLEILP